MVLVSARRSRALLLRVLCLIVAAMLALCACSDGEGAVKIDTARLAAIEALTPAQYKAIKMVYVASVPFDKLDGLQGRRRRAALAIAMKPFRVACDGLEASDPLLGPSRAQCRDSVVLTLTPNPLNCTEELLALLLAPGGRETDNCRRAADKYRAALSRLDESARVADRAVRATHLPRACQRALLTPNDYYVRSRTYDLALRKLARALGTDAKIDDGQAALDALAGHHYTGPTSQQFLDQLRRHCH